MVLAPLVAERIVGQAHDGREDAATAVLPLLEFTLAELWKRRTGHRLTVTALDDLGGGDCCTIG